MAKRVEAVKAAIQALDVSNKEKKALQKQANTIAASKGGKTTIGKKELDQINKLISTAGGTKVSEKTTAKGFQTTSTATNTATETYDDYLKKQAEEAKRQERINWKDYFRTTLTNWGLTTLIDDALNFVDKGFTDDIVVLKLQETAAWKQRFAANEQRKAKGLDIIDPATYLQLESDYQSAMRAIGLPQGFYDSTSDFTNLIAADLSPAEFNARLNAAAQVVEGADPLFKQELKRFYGLSDGDMIAYSLDPEKALPLIERKVQTVQFGAEATRAGISVGLGTAEQFGGTMGVSQEQARAGFQQVASLSPDVQRLSSFSRQVQTPVTQEDIISFQFGGEGAAQTKKNIEALAQEEMSRFAGQSGVRAGSLARTQGGQF
jgi:hypothetical protein